LLKNPISRALLLAGVCLAALAPFFWQGIPSGHDFEFHMFSWMEVVSQWKAGIAYPHWAELAHFGYGEARFLFYPPVSWTLGASLGEILPWKLVPAAYCWIALTLAGLAMYRLARQWLAPSSALFAALFYALNPYHLLIIYWRSAYAELLAASLLPLLLLFLLQMCTPQTRPDLRPTLCLGFTLAAAWLTNIPAAVMIHYSVAGLALLLSVLAIVQKTPGGTSEQRWSPQRVDPVLRILARTALAVLLGAGLASFYLIPTFHEQRWINLAEVMSPGVRPHDNFIFTTLADPDHNRFNLLISTIAVAEIGALFLAIAFSMRKNRVTGPSERNQPTPLWLPLSAWGIASALLMVNVSNALWSHLPELRYVQLPFRWLLCLNAALAILLAQAALRWSSRLLACALLLATLLVAGYCFQLPWWDQSADIREMSDAVADGTGYEGSDEYVPAGADPYELDKNLPRLSNASGEPVQSQMLAWQPNEKHFTIHAAAPQNLTIRLFSYPAWAVVVNGKPVDTQKTDVTGLLVIPIAAGDNDVQINFRRTIDRAIGNAVSLLSLGVFVILWMRTRPMRQL
jgi:uncharacterized membrane protein